MMKKTETTHLISKQASDLVGQIEEKRGRAGLERPRWVRQKRRRDKLAWVSFELGA